MTSLFAHAEPLDLLVLGMAASLALLVLLAVIRDAISRMPYRSEIDPMSSHWLEELDQCARDEHYGPPINWTTAPQAFAEFRKSFAAQHRE